jgi:hypothetical protein
LVLLLCFSLRRYDGRSTTSDSTTATVNVGAGSGGGVLARGELAFVTIVLGGGL